jgi:hypothetical protein
VDESRIAAFSSAFLKLRLHPEAERHNLVGFIARPTEK